MNEQWEICTIEFVTIEIPLLMLNKMKFSPTGAERSKLKLGNQEKEICQLLADGWEPYAVTGEGKFTYCFRRRISG